MLYDYVVVHLLFFSFSIHFGKSLKDEKINLYETFLDVTESFFQILLQSYPYKKEEEEKVKKKKISYPGIDKKEMDKKKENQIKIFFWFQKGLDEISQASPTIDDQSMFSSCESLSLQTKEEGVEKEKISVQKVSNVTEF